MHCPDISDISSYIGVHELEREGGGGVDYGGMGPSQQKNSA